MEKPMFRAALAEEAAYITDLMHQMHPQFPDVSLVFTAMEPGSLSTRVVCVAEADSDKSNERCRCTFEVDDTGKWVLLEGTVTRRQQDET